MPAGAPPCLSLAPGLAPAIYPGDDARCYEAARAVFTQARLPILHLHSTPGPQAEALLTRARREFPGLRLWFGIPGNHLVRDDGPELAAKYVRRARVLGAEVTMLNCEGPNDADDPGWKENAGKPRLTMTELHTRAEAVVAACASELGPSMILGFTSHDMPGSHKLPWEGFLGAKSAVRLHHPQQYGAPERSRKETAIPARASAADVLARMERSDAQWRAQVAKGRVRPDLAPGSTTGGFGVYVQLHDLSLAAQCRQLDRAATVSGWVMNRQTGEADRGKFPECDDVGVRGLIVMGAIHRIAGPGPGAIARFQASAGLAADGLVGRKTLEALGLAA